MQWKHMLILLLYEQKNTTLISHLHLLWVHCPAIRFFKINLELLESYTQQDVSYQDWKQYHSFLIVQSPPNPLFTEGLLPLSPVPHDQHGKPQLVINRNVKRWQRNLIYKYSSI